MTANSKTKKDKACAQVASLEKTTAPGMQGSERWRGNCVGVKSKSPKLIHILPERVKDRMAPSTRENVSRGLETTPCKEEIKSGSQWGN